MRFTVALRPGGHVELDFAANGQAFGLLLAPPGARDFIANVRRACASARAAPPVPAGFRAGVEIGMVDPATGCGGTIITDVDSWDRLTGHLESALDFLACQPALLNGQIGHA
jgi:hypothetical protein